MDVGGSCKVSMLLNWYTVDSCFLSSSFRARSSAGFFAVCFCSFLLVIALEFLRRLQRNYDHHLRAKNGPRYQSTDGKELEEYDDRRRLVGMENTEAQTQMDSGSIDAQAITEQLARGAIHMLQFAISYIIMLLVMYSNGYVILSILLGALVGFGLFTRDMIHQSSRPIRYSHRAQ